MTDIATASKVLIDAADELDRVSKALVVTEEQLAPVEAVMTEFVEDYIVGLWTRHVEQGEKHPPEETRKALAHRAFSRAYPEQLEQIYTLRAARGRGKSRLSDLREIVAAQRSIVSAAKTELDAVSGPQPSWSR